jgi:hypothetical protein
MRARPAEAVEGPTLGGPDTERYIIALVTERAMPRSAR